MIRFFDDKMFDRLLDGGDLHPMVRALQDLPQLVCIPRGGYATIYYKAARLFQINSDLQKRKRKHTWMFVVTKKYCDNAKLLDLDWFTKCKTDLDSKKKGEYEFNLDLSKCDYDFWYRFFVCMMCGVNRHRLQHRDEEKEIQQRIMTENNSIKEPTDYLVLDMEYQQPGDRSYGRFDMVALRWPGHMRKNPDYQPELALIEVKHGSRALAGPSGMQDHLNKIDCFRPDKEFYDGLDKMLNQMHQLGLIKLHSKIKKPIEVNRKAKKQFIFALGNCSQESHKLHNIVKQMQEPKNYQLRFVTSSFIGYGLYEDRMMTLPQFRDLLAVYDSATDCGNQSQGA